MENQPMLLEVKDLRTYFYTQQGVGKAVNGVDFDLRRGETLGIVGESGCGKSITALSILRLHPKHVAKIVSGRILFKGQDLLQLPEKAMRQYRGRHISMILQDPMSALNPVFNIGNQVKEPIRIHQRLMDKSLNDRAVDILKRLRVPAAETRLASFPHEFSGGMRQRVVGAIALSCEPDLLIADEPTTSLDVTIQAQYLKLLRTIQRDQGLSIIFITHDFGIVARMCDQVVVLYAGQVVENAPTKNLLRIPKHPYTQALLNSLPLIGLEMKKRLYSIEGQPPSIYHLPNGCSFAPRCEYVMDHCSEQFPPKVLVEPGHTVSCWKYV